MTIRTNAAAYRKALRRLPESYRKHALAAVHKGTQAFLEDFPDARLSGRPGLNDTSSRIAGSITPHVSVGQDHARAQVVFGVPDARAHEHGAVITPKRRRWLTIPKDDVKTKGSVLRGGARSFSNLVFVLVNNLLALLIIKGKRAIQGDKLRPVATTINPTRPRVGTIRPRAPRANRRGVKVKGKIAFILKKQVIIPKRLGFGPFWKNHWSKGRGKLAIQKERAALIQEWRRGL